MTNQTSKNHIRQSPKKVTHTSDDHRFIENKKRLCCGCEHVVIKKPIYNSTCTVCENCGAINNNYFNHDHSITQSCDGDLIFLNMYSKMVGAFSHDEWETFKAMVNIFDKEIFSNDEE